MKNVFLRTSIFTLLLSFLCINHCISQKQSAEFQIFCLDSDSQGYFRGNAHIVINHEEQWYGFKDFSNAVGKNSSLKIKFSERLSSSAFKVGTSIKTLQIKRGGKSLKIQNVLVDKKSSKGNKTEVRLKYKSVE